MKTILCTSVSIGVLAAVVATVISCDSSTVPQTSGGKSTTVTWSPSSPGLGTEVYFDDFDDGDYDGWTPTPVVFGSTGDHPDVVTSPEGYALRGIGSGYPCHNAPFAYPLVLSNVGEIALAMRARSGSGACCEADVALLNGDDFYRGIDYGQLGKPLFHIHVNGQDYWYWNSPISAASWHDLKWVRDADGWWSLYVDGNPWDMNFVQENTLHSFDNAFFNVTANQSEIEWVRFSAGGEPPEAPDPILYWSFNDPGDVGHDDSGNGHNLIIPGPWASVDGMLGHAIQFDSYGSGTNWGPSPLGPYTSTSGLDYPGPNGFTVAYWAKVEPGTWPLVGDYWQHVAHGVKFGLKVYPDSDRIYFEVYHAFSAPTIIEVPASPYLGQWIHVAGIYEPVGYAITVYINGEVVAQGNLPAPMRAATPPYLYTCGSWHATNPGTVDEVRIYDEALSSSEIAELASGGGPSDGLVLFREADDKSWECLGSGGDCIPGWDHSGVHYEGIVYESHPPYAAGDYWDPIDSEYVSIQMDSGVQAQHTLGSFQHDSQLTTTTAANDAIPIPSDLATNMVAFIGTQMDAGFLYLCPSPFSFSCWQEVLMPDRQKGRITAEYTCVGLLERASEEAGHNGGEGFIPNAMEAFEVPGIGDIPTLSPWLLHTALSTSDTITGVSDWIMGLFDPVDYILTDPLGRRIGHTAAHGTFNEIPNGFMSGDGDMEQLLLLGPAPGVYKLELYGVGEHAEAALGGTVSGQMFAGLLDDGATAVRYVCSPECTGIDIKPGDDTNSINLGSRGVIPVAILTTEDFDATMVDPNTVLLAGSGVAIRGNGNKLLASHEDVDEDGDIDLMLHVETENLTLETGATEAILTAQTYSGEELVGFDTINIVGD